MVTWEVDVELRVRKTLIFCGPEDPDAATCIVEDALKPDGLNVNTLMKWRSEAPGGRLYPAEVVIDNDPQIVDVRLVDD